MLMMENQIGIPHQLSDELFIVLEPKSKDPKKGWSWLEHKMTKDKIELWINKMGYNYGVTYSTDLALLDADNSSRLSELHVLDAFADTYTVKSGRTDSIGKHIYFRMTGNIPADYGYLDHKKIILTDPQTKTELGDIRTPGSNFFNVGPYSIHPKSGQRYLPVDEDVDILQLKYAEFFDILNNAGQLPENKPVSKTSSGRTESANITGEYPDYGFTVFDFLSPLNPRKTSSGEIEGAHPVHGSTSGHNLTVTADGSKWYCRRCGTGGGWMKALAVSRGIIDCSEAGRQFTPREYKEVLNVLRDLNPDVYEKQWLAYQRNRFALQMKRFNNSGKAGEA